jgi:hypothetical protein
MNAARPQFHESGHDVLRVGVLTPHAAVGPEAEFPAMAPGRVVTCIALLSLDEAGAGAGASSTTPGLRAPSRSPLLDQAAELLGRRSLDAIAWSVGTAGCSHTTPGRRRRRSGDLRRRYVHCDRQVEGPRQNTARRQAGGEARGCRPPR